MYTDSHTHLYLDAFDGDRDEMIRRAIRSGVTRMYLPNLDSTSVEAMHAVSAAFPGNCFPMMGLHPTSVKENYKEELDRVKQLIGINEYAAIGEIGIDLYWDATYVKEQTEAFRQQIRWAKETGLPIVIHARNSFDEIFSVMDEENNDALNGVFHSFTGNAKQAKQALSYGFKLGINGIITFKNSGLDRVVAGIDPSNLLIETDAPFLAPVPYRGKRNESMYVIEVARKIAEIHVMQPEDVASITTENALNLFPLS
jgi:TatD DNase family protein